MILALKHSWLIRNTELVFQSNFDRTFNQPVCVCLETYAIKRSTIFCLPLNFQVANNVIRPYSLVKQHCCRPVHTVPNNESHSSARLNASPNIERQIKKECYKRKEIKITNFGVPKIDLDSQPKCQISKLTNRAKSAIENANDDLYKNHDSNIKDWLVDSFIKFRFQFVRLKIGFLCVQFIVNTAFRLIYCHLQGICSCVRE